MQRQNVAAYVDIAGAGSSNRESWARKHLVAIHIYESFVITAALLGPILRHVMASIKVEFIHVMKV
jgi:hypothetical protein